MKTGEVTDVIRTKQGYVILQVTEHQSRYSLVEGSRAASSGRPVHAETAARLARLSEQVARTGIHRHKPGYVDSGLARSRPSLSKPPPKKLRQRT